MQTDRERYKIGSKKKEKKKLDWGKHLARSNGTTSLHGNLKISVEVSQEEVKTRVVGKEGVGLAWSWGCAGLSRFGLDQ